jgi:hypothetical protein
MLPSPTFTSYSLHQKILGYWQFYPLYIHILQFIFIHLFFSPNRTTPAEEKTATATKHDLSHLRTVYIFTLVLSTLTHIATLSLSLSSVFFPSLFTPSIAAEFHPSRIFLPLSPFAPSKIVTLAEGCLNLLQWDAVFVSILGLFLAVMGYRRAGAGNGLMIIVSKGVGLSVLVGPGSAALVAMWRRDELVFGVEREAHVKEL